MCQEDLLKRLEQCNLEIENTGQIDFQDEEENLVTGILLFSGTMDEGTKEYFLSRRQDILTLIEEGSYDIDKNLVKIILTTAGFKV